MDPVTFKEGETVITKNGVGTVIGIYKTMIMVKTPMGKRYTAWQMHPQSEVKKA